MLFFKTDLFGFKIKILHKLFFSLYWISFQSLATPPIKICQEKQSEQIISRFNEPTPNMQIFSHHIINLEERIMAACVGFYLFSP
jgi:hypothetical protein